MYESEGEQELKYLLEGQYEIKDVVRVELKDDVKTAFHRILQTIPMGR